MVDELLCVYLNDHLAGSVVAIEQMEHFVQANPGSPPAEVVESLLPAIREDQAVLKDLIARLDQPESSAKKTTAWLLEKASRLKFHGHQRLDQFEELEAILLGILGKRALWRSLRHAASSAARFGDIDFVRLERSAADQHDRLEQAKLVLADELFAPAAPV